MQIAKYCTKQPIWLLNQHHVHYIQIAKAEDANRKKDLSSDAMESSDKVRSAPSPHLPKKLYAEAKKNLKKPVSTATEKTATSATASPLRIKGKREQFSGTYGNLLICIRNS